MEKKTWTSPRIELVQFGANEYVATCYRSASFECNANGNIFWDNGNGTAQTLDAANGGHHAFVQTWPTVNGLDPTLDFTDFNYSDFYKNTNNGANADQLMGTLPFGSIFDPDTCDHSGTAYENQVSYGWAVGYYETNQQFVFSSQTQKVIIWHNTDSNGNLIGLHAMLNNWTFSNGKYDSSIWSAKNAS